MNRRTISGKIEIDRKTSEDNDRLLALIDAAVRDEVPSWYNYTYEFLDFGIQDGITDTVELMFSVDVQFTEQT